MTGLFTALTSAALAATPAPAEWQAFIGCWHPQDAPATTLLCVVPDGAGVRLIDVEKGAIVHETRVIADNQQRAVSQEGCSGFESARWSADGERVYLRSELNCGQRIPRNTSSVFAFVSRTEWMSVQAVTIGEEGGARTTRYEEVPGNSVPASIAALLPANRMARETARFAAANPLGFDDILEAAKSVEPRAVEALVLARQEPLPLTGKQLMQLADAGVPAYVIDATIAVTHPEIFVVRERSDDRNDRRMRPYGSRDRYCDDYAYIPGYGYGQSYGAFDDYRCSRPRLGLGYSPYSPWGYYGGGWGYGYYGTPVIVVRGSAEDEFSGGSASRSGYSRGRSTSTRRAEPRDDHSPSTTSASRPSTTSGGGSSSAGSGSSSSGSSSSGEGRTAKPRDK